MKRNVYCPECLKRGKKKILCKVDANVRGTLYLWCKEDRKEIEIKLNIEPMSHR
jgi:hypothetical protein